MTVGIHQPATVPLGRQRDQPDRVSQLVDYSSNSEGRRVPYRIHVLLGKTRCGTQHLCFLASKSDLRTTIVESDRLDD